MDRYEDEEKQFRDELFFTFHVELAPWAGHQLVVETRFELQPDCFCDQAVCHYNSAISPTEHFSTLLNTTPQIDHNCHVQWKYAMQIYLYTWLSWTGFCVRFFNFLYPLSHHYYIFGIIRPVQQCVIKVNENPEGIALCMTGQPSTGSVDALDDNVNWRK